MFKIKKKIYIENSSTPFFFHSSKCKFKPYVTIPGGVPSTSVPKQNFNIKERRYGVYFTKIKYRDKI